MPTQLIPVVSGVNENNRDLFTYQLKHYRMESKLTKREKEILKLLAHGNSNRKISENLHISIKTTETHRKNIMAKLGAINSCNMVYIAVRKNII